MEQTTKPLFSNRDLVSLIWPLLAEQFLSVLVGIIDVLMVASVGETAMSGVSLVDSINSLVIQVLFAISAGGTVICAQFIGSGHKKTASKATAQLVLLNFIMTTSITILFVIGGRDFLGLIFGQVEANVMKNATVYMFLTALSFPMLGIYQSITGAFRALGNTKLAMYISLLMNGLNIAGNAICIFGLHMGVEGVAIPTFLSRTVAAGVIFYFFQKEENEIKIQHLSDLLPDLQIIKKILSIGIPNGVESGMFQFGKLILQSLVATLGTPSIAGFAVASNLATFYYLPGNALGAGTLTIVGQCTGAGLNKQAKQYTKKMLFLNYAILSVICTIMILGRDFWIDCYHLSAEAHTFASGLVLSHGIAMILWPIAFLTPYYFRAIGKATFTMIVAIFTMWAFRVGLAVLFVRVLGMNVLSIWYAMFIDWLFRVIIYVIAFYRENGSCLLKHEDSCKK